MSDCFKLKQRRQGQNDSKPTGFISKTCNLPSNVNDVRGTILEEKSSSDSVMQSFEPFIHDVFVSLSSDLTNSNPVKILRDTGASQSLLLANTLPFSDVSFTGTNVLIKGVDSTEFTSIPLHNAYLSSDLVSGHVVVGILPSLPFDGVHLLLGNDLAGSKVEVNPLVTDKPSVDPNTDSIEQEIPGLFPSCAVTRSMTQSKSTSDDVTTDVDLADTFLSRVINDDNVSDVTNDDFSAKAQTFSRSDLIREQNSDPDVSCLFARSVDECDVSRDPVCFYTKNDVLMRKWRPSDVPADDEWAVKHQIVVPSSYRPHILSLAHDTPMSGHLGINKTYQRILHFYWPNLRKDAQPIKQHPYRLNPQKEEYLKNEVQYLLDNDFIEPSQSNWSTIRQFYDRLSEAKLTINLSKSEFACATVTFLGHVVGQGQIKPVDSKVCAINDFPRPENKKQLMRFLGMAGYYRKFCPNFSTISERLTQLLKKTRKFVWSDDCEKSFVKLKAILKSSPVLQAPDFYSQFKLAVDASNAAAGAVLLQEGNDGIDHPICYFSRKFNKNQRNYSTVEKECLALILALQHFEVYVTSSSFPIIVYSDHNPLVFLHKLRSKNQRLLRWSLMLQEFNIIVKHIRGKDNLIADCLSRL